MTGKQNAPEIRFEGFTDPWEQRKLGGLFFESNERSSSRVTLSTTACECGRALLGQVITMVLLAQLT